MATRSIRGIALASALAVSATAANAVGFTSLTVFGDSLSDTGNLFAATGGTLPASPPYFDGRFSNGPIWADTLAASFDAKGLETLNFAYGGAHALPDAAPPPDLPDQLGLFALTPAPDLGDRPIASLLFGSNDIFGAVGTPGLEAVATAAANAVADAALAPSGFGFGDFLIFNLPDLGQTPAYRLFAPPAAPAATAATLVFNETLAGRVSDLRAGGINVIDGDLFGFFNEMVADPAKYGVTDTTLPCLFPNPEAAAFFGQPLLCEGADQTGRAFFDGVHPNGVIHQQVAGIVAARVAPVPLPATALLLFAGFAGLVAIRRRV